MNNSENEAGNVIFATSERVRQSWIMLAEIKDRTAATRELINDSRNELSRSAGHLDIWRRD